MTKARYYFQKAILVLILLGAAVSIVPIVFMFAECIIFDTEDSLLGGLWESIWANEYI